MPAATPSDPSLLVVGALPDVVEDQFKRTFDALSIPVAFLPARQANELPSVGPATKFLLAQPFLGETGRRLEARQAVHLPAPFPFGVEGTTAWLTTAAKAFGVSDDLLQATIDAPRKRAESALAKFRETLQGRRILFLPGLTARGPLGPISKSRTRYGAGRSRHSILAPAVLAAGARPSSRRRHRQRRTGRRAPTRPLPGRQARHRGLRARTRQPFGGRRHDDQVVDRTRLHPGSRLRTGSRPGRTFRSPSRSATKAAGCRSCS